MLSLLLKYWKYIVIAISIVISYISIHQRNIMADENKIITVKIDSLAEMTKSVSNINKKQNEIATSTNVNIASIHAWLLELSANYKS